MTQRRFTAPSLLLAALMAVTVSSSVSGAGPADLAVVVNPANRESTADRGELRAIFRTTRTSWDDGQPIVAFNLPDTSEQRALFDHVVLGMDADEAARYWVDRKIRGGARPPRKLPNAAAVKRVVSTDAKAIGYVNRGDVDSSVKVIAWVTPAGVSSP